jgi:hypothetical protein
MALTNQQLQAIRDKYGITPLSSSGGGATTAVRGGQFQKRNEFLRGLSSGASVDKVGTTARRTQTEDEGLLDRILGREFVDVQIGAAKGVASTVRGLGSLSEKFGEKLTGIESTSQGTLAEKLIPEKFTEPTNIAQQVGKTTEQIGEFFVPGGAVGRGAKVIKEAKVLSKLPGAIKAGAGVAAAAIGEGVTAGAITAAQTGSVEKGKDVGKFVAALTPLTFGVSKIISRIPETAWSKILKRTPTVAQKNPLLPKQAVETGITGGTRSSLLQQSKNGIQAMEVALDDLLASSKKTVDAKRVSEMLSELIESYKAVPGEGQSVERLLEIQAGMSRRGLIPVLEANQIKRSIYKVIENSYGRGLLDAPAKTSGQKLLARGLKEEVESLVPEAKNINQKQAVYIQMKKALERAIASTEGKGIMGTGIGITDLLLATVGAPTTGLGLVVGKKVLESPMSLTSAAKFIHFFNNLPPTKKAMFFNAINGLTSQAVKSQDRK